MKPKHNTPLEREVLKECPQCEARVFWLSAGGGLFCGQCRPPRDRAQVLGWIRPTSPREG